MRTIVFLLCLVVMAISVRADASDLDHALATRDYSLARTLANAGATKGDPHSQYVLGTLLIGGHGGAKDPQTGAEWLDKAGNQGHGEAMAFLAVAHYYGAVPDAQDWRAIGYLWAADILGINDAGIMAMMISGDITEEELVLGKIWLRRWGAETGLYSD